MISHPYVPINTYMNLQVWIWNDKYTPYHLRKNPYFVSKQSIILSMSYRQYFLYSLPQLLEPPKSSPMALLLDAETIARGLTKGGENADQKPCRVRNPPSSYEEVKPPVRYVRNTPCRHFGHFTSLESLDNKALLVTFVHLVFTWRSDRIFWKEFEKVGRSITKDCAWEENLSSICSRSGDDMFGVPETPFHPTWPSNKAIYIVTLTIWKITDVYWESISLS